MTAASSAAGPPVFCSRCHSRSLVDTMEFDRGVSEPCWLRAAGYPVDPVFSLFRDLGCSRVAPAGSSP